MYYRYISIREKFSVSESVWLISVSLLLRVPSDRAHLRLSAKRRHVRLALASHSHQFKFFFHEHEKRVHDLTIVCAHKAPTCRWKRSVDFLLPRVISLSISLFLSLHFSCVYLSVLLDSLITPSLLLDFTPPSSISFPFAPFNFIRSFLLHDVWCFAFVPVIRRKKRIIDRKCWSQMLNSSSARCSWALWESKCGGLRSLLSLIVPASNIVTRVFNFSLVTPLNVTLDRLNVGLKYFILIAKSYLLFNMLFY